MNNSEFKQDFRIFKNPSKKTKNDFKPKMKNENEKTFKCEICSKSFKTNSNLYSHFLSSHKGKTFKCDFCPSSFTTKGSYKRHIASVHNGKKMIVTFVHQVLHRKVP